MAKKTNQIASQFSLFGRNNTQNSINVIIPSDFSGSREDIEKLLGYTTNPTDLQLVVLSLYNNMKDNTSTKYVSRPLPAFIADKIIHNDVNEYRFVIESKFAEGNFWIKEAYSALETDRPGNKSSLQSYINFEYLKIKGKICSNFADDEVLQLEEIRKNSDIIITQMIDLLLKKVNCTALDISYESALNSVTLVVIDAIVDCKVLENINKL
ncbi:hypothetical protein VB776_07185 [Arcicella sp. DC2W]|uniref:Uncharacterized protein n=1 Tax=Arcicella gelida TaxID=2984195 RepID=A0ABU5S2M4_9BACT|nr:hypothetical protein [Arcicella sp. DC2W]MEA5402690.1 hypothetical protein [Arcicella sp. DC2W]